LHLLQHPRYELGILDELDAKIVKPYKKNKENVLLQGVLNRESILDMYTY
jgi:hypothetical protein